MNSYGPNLGANAACLKAGPKPRALADMVVDDEGMLLVAGFRRPSGGCGVIMASLITVTGHASRKAIGHGTARTLMDVVQNS